MPTVKCPFCLRNMGITVKHGFINPYTNENGEITTRITWPLMINHCVTTKCFRKHFTRLEGRFDVNFNVMIEQIKNWFRKNPNSPRVAELKAVGNKDTGIWWNIIMKTRSANLAVKVMTAMSRGKIEEVADEIEEELMEDITASKMNGWFRPRYRSGTTPETTATNLTSSTTNSSTADPRVQSNTSSIRETYPTTATVKEMIDAAVAAATAPLLARVAELEALIKKPEAPAAVDPIIDDEETRPKKQKKEKKLKFSFELEYE